MTRWLAILMLLASCNGCMMLEDLMYDDVAPRPQPTCATPPVRVQQTAEPPR